MHNEIKGKDWFENRKSVWPLLVLILIVADLLALAIFFT